VSYPHSRADGVLHPRYEPADSHPRYEPADSHPRYEPADSHPRYEPADSAQDMNLLIQNSALQ